METALAESTALSSKSEREYITLRDTLKGMKTAWRADVDSLREDMHKREERSRNEAEVAGKKYAKLLEESKLRKADVASVQQLREEDTRIRHEVEEEFREEIRTLNERVRCSSEASERAEKTAECVLFFYGTCLNWLSCVRFHTGIWRVSWLVCEDSCGLQVKQHLKVHPRRA